MIPVEIEVPRFHCLRILVQKVPGNVALQPKATMVSFLCESMTSLFVNIHHGGITYEKLQQRRLIIR